MTKQEAVKNVWDMVTTGNIRTAEEFARQHDVFMEFDEDYIAVEDDIFYLNEEC